MRGRQNLTKAKKEIFEGEINQGFLSIINSNVEPERVLDLMVNCAYDVAEKNNLLIETEDGLVMDTKELAVVAIAAQNTQMKLQEVKEDLRKFNELLIGSSIASGYLEDDELNRLSEAVGPVGIALSDSPDKIMETIIRSKNPRSNVAAFSSNVFSSKIPAFLLKEILSKGTEAVINIRQEDTDEIYKQLGDYSEEVIGMVETPTEENVLKAMAISVRCALLTKEFQGQKELIKEFDSAINKNPTDIVSLKNCCVKAYEALLHKFPDFVGTKNVLALINFADANLAYIDRIVEIVDSLKTHHVKEVREIALSLNLCGMVPSDFSLDVLDRLERSVDSELSKKIRNTILLTKQAISLKREIMEEGRTRTLETLGSAIKSPNWGRIQKSLTMCLECFKRRNYEVKRLRSISSQMESVGFKLVNANGALDEGRVNEFKNSYKEFQQRVSEVDSSYTIEHSSRSAALDAIFKFPLVRISAAGIKKIKFELNKRDRILAEIGDLSIMLKNEVKKRVDGSKIMEVAKRILDMRDKLVRAQIEITRSLDSINTSESEAEVMHSLKLEVVAIKEYENVYDFLKGVEDVLPKSRSLLSIARERVTISEMLMEQIQKTFSGYGMDIETVQKAFEDGRSSGDHVEVKSTKAFFDDLNTAIEQGDSGRIIMIARLLGCLAKDVEKMMQKATIVGDAFVINSDPWMKKMDAAKKIEHACSRVTESMLEDELMSCTDATGAWRPDDETCNPYFNKKVSDASGLIKELQVSSSGVLSTANVEGGLNDVAMKNLKKSILSTLREQRINVDGDNLLSQDDVERMLNNPDELDRIGKKYLEILGPQGDLLINAGLELFQCLLPKDDELGEGSRELFNEIKEFRYNADQSNRLRRLSIGNKIAGLGIVLIESGVATGFAFDLIGQLKALFLNGGLSMINDPIISNIAKILGIPWIPVFPPTPPSGPTLPSGSTPPPSPSVLSGTAVQAIAAAAMLALYLTIFITTRPGNKIATERSSQRMLEVLGMACMRQMKLVHFQSKQLKELTSLANVRLRMPEKILPEGVDIIHKPMFCSPNDRSNASIDSRVKILSTLFGGQKDEASAIYSKLAYNPLGCNAVMDWLIPCWMDNTGKQLREEVNTFPKRGMTEEDKKSWQLGHGLVMSICNGLKPPVDIFDAMNTSSKQLSVDVASLPFTVSRTIGSAESATYARVSDDSKVFYFKPYTTRPWPFLIFSGRGAETSRLESLNNITAMASPKANRTMLKIVQDQRQFLTKENDNTAKEINKLFEILNTHHSDIQEFALKCKMFDSFMSILDYRSQLERQIYAVKTLNSATSTSASGDGRQYLRATKAMVDPTCNLPWLLENLRIADYHIQLLQNKMRNKTNPERGIDSNGALMIDPELIIEYGQQLINEREKFQSIELEVGKQMATLNKLGFAINMERMNDIKAARNLAHRAKYEITKGVSGSLDSLIKPKGEDYKQHQMHREERHGAMLEMQYPHIMVGDARNKKDMFKIRVAGAPVTQVLDVQPKATLQVRKLKTGGGHLGYRGREEKAFQRTIDSYKKYQGLPQEKSKFSGIRRVGAFLSRPYKEIKRATSLERHRNDTTPTPTPTRKKGQERSVSPSAGKKVYYY